DRQFKSPRLQQRGAANRRSDLLMTNDRSIERGDVATDNVAQAIAAVGPSGVDSFTHTDVPGPRGKKDSAQVRAFVAAALRGFAAWTNRPWASPIMQEGLPRTKM